MWCPFQASNQGGTAGTTSIALVPGHIIYVRGRVLLFFTSSGQTKQEESLWYKNQWKQS